jgi:long-subunit fatty acid transport protein
MKKVMLTAVAVMAFGLSNAQDVKFGAKAGLNMSNYTGDVEGTDMKVGYQVGGFAEIKISEKFAVQPELVFTNLGAKGDFSGVTVTEHLNYLAIPVMAKYFVADKFSVEAGPQIGFLMSAKMKADGESVDTKDEYNSTDFGLNVGVGYDITENIGVGLRYTAGLSNIAKDSGDFKQGNSNIALSVGYKF